MRIVRVEGNIKAGCAVEIGEKTLIVGPNGSGKSSIVNTVELALTGRASDVAGRVDVAREVDVMSLSKDGSAELAALTTFDDGVVAAYYTSGSTAKAKKATGDKPEDRCHEDVLPIRTLREALLGSPATARKFLLSKMSDGVTLAAAKEMVDEEVHPLFDALVKRSDVAAMRPADALVAALESAGSRAREATATAKAAIQAATFVTGGAAIPPSIEEINTAQEKARELQDAYAKAVAEAASALNGPRLQQDLEDAEAEALAAVQSFKQAEEAFNGTGDPTPPVPGIDSLLAAAKMSLDAGECLVCGNTEIGDLSDLVTKVEEAATEYRDARDARNAHRRELAQLKSAADLALRYYEQAEKRLAEWQEKAVTDATPVNADGLRAQYDAQIQKVEELKSKRAAWDTAHQARRQADAAQSEAESWSKLKEGLSLAVEKLVDGALAAFIQKVQSALPAGDFFVMRLRDGDREVVQFGLMRDGHLNTALSGAEWARVIAAMASACVPAGRYACIIPEERAFDPMTLSAVMRALATTPHQVIITSPIAPKSPPKGWTIIKRGEE